jgi:hypothetical protein
MSEMTPRNLRAHDEVWMPFAELTQAAEKMGAAAVLRRFMMAYLEEYKVFWAPADKDNPASESVAFYECDECDLPHRLDGSDKIWGCSVLKAHSDRMAKAGRT